MKIVLKRGEKIIKTIDTDHRRASKKNREKEQEHVEKKEEKDEQVQEKEVSKPKEKPKPTIECPLGYKFYTKEEMCDFYGVRYSDVFYYNFDNFDKYRQAIMLKIIEKIDKYTRDKVLDCGITVIKVDNDFCECTFDGNPLIINVYKLYDYMLAHAKKVYDEKMKREKEEIA